MQTLIYIILATLAVSLLSLIGVISLLLKKGFVEKITFYLVSFSVGALLGGALLHLIPEAYEEIQTNFVFILVLIGFLSFFIIEKVLHWRHCHEEHCKIHKMEKVHSFGYLNLFGDGIHNFIDGIIIAAAFITSPIIGLTTSLIIILHELPQELGDFAVLLYAGFSKQKALLFNFLSAIVALFGGILGFFLLNSIESIIPFLLAFAAGGFLYIAASDLMPHIIREKSLEKSFIYLLIVILGILLIYGMRFIGNI
jgi:zinc and cadmium transporter